MSLLYKTGDLLASGESAIAHGVNCRGAMGSGIAKPIREHFGEGMYREYSRACLAGEMLPGDINVWQEDPYCVLYNLATQLEPGPDARYSAILRSVDLMLAHAEAVGIDRIGIPKIGCGIGGLEWPQTEGILLALCEQRSVDLIVYTLTDNLTANPYTVEEAARVAAYEHDAIERLSRD